MVLMFVSCWSGCVCSPALLPPLHGFLLLWVYEGVTILEVHSEAHRDKVIWEKYWFCSRTSQQLSLDLLSPFHMLPGLVSSATNFHLERRSPEQVPLVPVVVPAAHTYVVNLTYVLLTEKHVEVTEDVTSVETKILTSR